MTNRTRRRMNATWLTCLTALVGSTGCFGLNRGAPPQQHYVLGGGSPLADDTLSGDLAGRSIGLRRLQIAPYLDTPFIVVRRGPHQIVFSELHRWGEDLGGGINRAVAGHLSDRASIGAVDVAPWGSRERYDYLIQLHVLRFEGLVPEDGAPSDGEVHMLATWEIIRQDPGEVLTRGVTDYRERGWNVGDFVGLVTLLDAGLAILSHDLAAAIGRLTLDTP